MEFKSVNNLEFNSAVSGHKQNEERCYWKNSVAPRQFANKYERGGGGVERWRLTCLSSDDCWETRLAERSRGESWNEGVM